MTFEAQPHTGGHKAENILPFQLLSQSELVWWPYRSLSRSLLQTHRNTSAMLEINRMLADEMRDIARREQDFLLNLSEQIFNRKNDGESLSKRVSFLPPETVDEIFETAISGVRQFGQAVADAQIRSLEAFRQHARDAAGMSQQAAPHAQAAE
jgi:hypothetical protein